MKRKRFWRNWYLTGAALTFPMFGLLAWLSPTEEQRAEVIAVIIFSGIVWTHGILFIAPSLDGDTKWK